MTRSSMVCVDDCHVCTHARSSFPLCPLAIRFQTSGCHRCSSHWQAALSPALPSPLTVRRCSLCCNEQGVSRAEPRRTRSVRTASVQCLLDRIINRLGQPAHVHAQLSGRQHAAFFACEGKAGPGAASVAPGVIRGNRTCSTRAFQCDCPHEKTYQLVSSRGVSCLAS